MLTPANSGSFPPDTCYILSFAVIMLNTSLHNPNVKEKTSLQCFISMNRGINNGANLPAELLTVSRRASSLRSLQLKQEGNEKY